MGKDTFLCVFRFVCLKAISCIILAERISSVIELIEPLQRFIESSTMGEFVSRVQMLQAFYREMCYEDKDANNVEGNLGPSQ